MKRLCRELAADTRGSAIVEFAILAPAILTLFVGILQVGLWMQSYNALRTVAADTGRYVAVQYQKTNRIDNPSMALWARERAVGDFHFDNTKITADVSDAPVQSINGVTEKTLTITYTMPSLLGTIGGPITVTFARPIFVKT